MLLTGWDEYTPKVLPPTLSSPPATLVGMTRSPADEWRNNGARRRHCAAIILAPDENGRPPDCAICGQPGADSIDHVLPKVLYPELIWELGNMQPAHEDCNSSKGARLGLPSIGSQSEQW